MHKTITKLSSNENIDSPVKEFYVSFRKSQLNDFPLCIRSDAILMQNQALGSKPYAFCRVDINNTDIF